LIVSRAGRKKRIGVELTEYFNDAMPGDSSPVAAIDGFWRNVQTSLMRRISHLGHRPHLVETEARVTFGECPPPRKALAGLLAGELVAFASAQQIQEREYRTVRARDFGAEYPKMKRWVKSILLYRNCAGVRVPSRCSWECDNVSCGAMGLRLEYIKSIIETKNDKAANYDWRDAEEKWLLIVASDARVGNRSGPPVPEDTWNDEGLTGLCRESPYDRIFVWESVRCWCKSLRPRQETVSLKDGDTLGL
jgi:hypothetical protein